MSSSTCILSGASIRDGDRIVAVLVTPRLRVSGLFQQFAPHSPYHVASAASFPIRGTYGIFGTFEPDAGQPAVDYLCETVGTRNWADLQGILHKEGLGVRVGDGLPKTIQQRHAAFSLVHEDVYEAVIQTSGLSLEIQPAIDTVVSLSAALSDRSKRDERSLAGYRVIMLSSTSHLFGPDQILSATGDDRIGSEILARHVEKFANGVLDASDMGKEPDLDEARRVFGCVADLSIFSYVLMVAGVALQPSGVWGVDPEVRAKIAAMTLEKIIPDMVERNGESERPTPVVDEIRDMADRYEVLRSKAEVGMNL